MEVKEQYKKTEVGIIPEEWAIASLHDECKLITDGAHASPPTFPYGKPIATVENITHGFIDIENCRRISQEDFSFLIRNSCRPHKGDVLLSKDGTIGITFPILEDIDVVLLSSIAIIRPKDNLNPVFLSKILSSALFENYLVRIKTGSALKRIVLRDIKKLPIPCPPLQEQQAIAEVLSDTDNLIQALEKQIAKKRLIKQGVMQKLLTPKEGWVKKKLGESSDIFRGGSPRPIESYLTTNPDGINWIKIGDVGRFAKFIESTEEKIIPEGMSRSRFVKEGDFLLSNSMSFGRPYILKTRGCIHDGWLVIQNYQNHFDREFLYYVLGSESVIMQYKAMASGSSVLNLNKEIVKNVIINCPTSLKEQSRISAILSDIDNEINLLEYKLLKDKLIKQGLMQNLLTGKKRLLKS